MIATSLLEKLHQAKYVYINETFREIYVWHGTSAIKIYNYLGNEVAMFSVIKYNEDREYKKYEEINLRDVVLSIDDIVHSSYKNE